MIRYTQVIFVFSLSALLASCSYIYGDHGAIKNHDRDYLSAQSIQPLKIPPGYSSSSIQASYPVPDRNYPDATKIIHLTPPELKPA